MLVLTVLMFVGGGVLGRFLWARLTARVAVLEWLRMLTAPLGAGASAWIGASAWAYVSAWISASAWAYVSAWIGASAWVGASARAADLRAPRNTLASKYSRMVSITMRGTSGLT